MVRIAIRSPSPSLSVTVERRRPDVALVQVEGALDLDGAPTLCAAIADVRRHSGPWHAIVDLSAVEFCDSTGLKALIDAAREVAIDGGRLVAVVPEDGPVRRVLAITGAEEFLDVTPDRERLLAALAR